MNCAQCKVNFFQRAPVAMATILLRAPQPICSKHYPSTADCVACLALAPTPTPHELRSAHVIYTLIRAGEQKSMETHMHEAHICTFGKRNGWLALKPSMKPSQVGVGFLVCCCWHFYLRCLVICRLVQIPKAFNSNEWVVLQTLKLAGKEFSVSGLLFTLLINY